MFAVRHVWLIEILRVITDVVSDRLWFITNLIDYGLRRLLQCRWFFGHGLGLRLACWLIRLTVTVTKWLGDWLLDVVAGWNLVNSGSRPSINWHFRWKFDVLFGFVALTGLAHPLRAEQRPRRFYLAVFLNLPLGCFVSLLYFCIHVEFKSLFKNVFSEITFQPSQFFL